jgi:membrane peptidoglycan carboxypeptidase
VFADAGRDLPDIAPVVQAAAPGPHRVDVRSLPAHVYQAVVAAQDARFFAHGGYDGAAIVRAAGSDLAPTQWSRPAGGSTLTQQLAKSVLLKDEPRGVRRKIRELLLARRIEARLDKEEVLNAWLNSVYFGGGVTGLTGAAGAYFDVAPQDLTISQAAYLAGLPNAPERLRLDRAENRLEAVVTRDRIVQRMVREGYVTPVVAGRIAGESLTPVS